MAPQRPQIPPTPRTTPIKHLSEDGMWECREKGICYNFGEKFTWAHRCVEKNLYLLDVDSPPAPECFYDIQDPIANEDDI